MFGLQPFHLIIILVIALLIFGPSRLPEMGQSVGKSIREFRDAMSGAGDEMKKGLSEPQPKSDPIKPDQSKPDA